MAPAVNASLITTSYNQRATLELLFESLKRQTARGFEVIVADDGSSDGTRELCERATGLDVRFITQEDKGYRKSRILNEAIRQSRGDYLIFVDSDTVLERHFVEDHLRLRAPGAFVCGRRVDLGPEITPRLGVRDVARGFFDRPHLFLGEGTIGAKRSLRVSWPALRRVLKYDKPIDILGSNMSLWKSDLVAINGFNEALESYWGEDGDLFIRLRNSGRRSVGAKGLCIQYHLFHKRREPTPENVAAYEKLLARTDYVRCERGLS